MLRHLCIELRGVLKFAEARYEADGTARRTAASTERPGIREDSIAAMSTKVHGSIEGQAGVC